MYQYFPIFKARFLQAIASFKYLSSILIFYYNFRFLLYNLILTVLCDLKILNQYSNEFICDKMNEINKKIYICDRNLCIDIILDFDHPT